MIAGPHDKENYNYGFKNNKCIKVYSRKVSYISGNFISDVLEVKIYFSKFSCMFLNPNNFFQFEF